MVVVAKSNLPVWSCVIYEWFKKKNRNLTQVFICVIWLSVLDCLRDYLYGHLDYVNSHLHTKLGDSLCATVLKICAQCQIHSLLWDRNIPTVVDGCQKPTCQTFSMTCHDSKLSKSKSKRFLRIKCTMLVICHISTNCLLIVLCCYLVSVFVRCQSS